MKLWDKGHDSAERVTKFTVGDDRRLDLQLAKYDVLGSKAHAQMLLSIGILSDEEDRALQRELDELLVAIEKGDFRIEEEFEDIHSKIEFALTDKLGDVGKKIHTGRSRNDQILVDMHLYAKDQIINIKQGIKVLFDQLLSQSEKYKDALLPGYTHYQLAMPSSFGLWFGAYAESLIDDVYLINGAYSIADQNPLGSGAGYGSSLPLDRSMTTKKLGFATLKYNSIAAQMSRGKLEKSLAIGIASVAGTLSKLAYDITLYMNQNFGFVSFPDDLTTGSSIMPHKKNPDVFELIRAKCNKIQALPNELAFITNNMASGYHRDFQLVKGSLLSAVEMLKSCLEMASFMLQNIQVNKHIFADDKYDSLFSVEEVNRLVKEGISFRDAYREVAKSIQAGTFNPGKNLAHTHEGSIGNLCTKEIREKFKIAFIVNSIAGFKQ